MCLGIPGRILQRWDNAGELLARADFAGEVRQIRLNYLPELAVGDWVIVHAGFALTKLSEDDARQTLATMRDVGLLPPLDPPVDSPADSPVDSPEATTTRTEVFNHA